MLQNTPFITGFIPAQPLEPTCNRPTLRLVPHDALMAAQWRDDVEIAALLRGLSARINGDIISPNTPHAHQAKQHLSSAQRLRGYQFLAEHCPLTS